ncbi:hypothetical protein [Glycomyces buryatensis]|uniref:WXG100 family type VII secretion target n=1 Tax=Glycomyces buryatensis TaxID=2570927 RepID=A0A4S8QB02_9ACTN|nr:hypothetical protein [Glycomyces buryatensis]THV41518.1 hypothetical protein FAB82_10415 [Glycomyces buryatensis]
MPVHMDIEDVRTGGNRLRMLATQSKNASDRVQTPAATAADTNPGFTAGGAGKQWQTALANVTAGLERRMDWQGSQVVGSANDLDSSDQQTGNRFKTVSGELPGHQS